jgi:UMF1 family MFS transporter
MNQTKPLPKEPASNTAQVAWVVHEWATQPYFSLVTIFLFAPYFTSIVIGDPTRGQAIWGYTQAFAGAVLALSSPLLGAMADAAGPRKPWIVVFMMLCAVGCFGLWFAQPDMPVLPVLIALVIASLGMEYTIIFSNAMLPTIASERRLGMLSGVGIGVGQLAAIVALVMALLWLFLPGVMSVPGLVPMEPLFGLSREAHETDRIIGPIAGLWLILFMLPMLLLVPDQASRGLARLQAAREGVRRLTHTLRSVKHFRNVALYLLARMSYYDGMNAIIIFGGILAASIFGWGSLQLAVYGILVTFFAAVGAFVSGWTDQRFGSRATLIWALSALIIIFVVILSFDRTHIFFFVEVPLVEGSKPFSTLPEQLFTVTVAFFGLAVGPIIASSRTMMARIAPLDMMTEFYGLYSLAGKATSFLAPLLIGLLTAATGSQKLGLIVVIPLIVGGLVALLFVKEERATSLSRA